MKKIKETKGDEMKKSHILFIISSIVGCLYFYVNPLYSTHTILRNAGNLTSGTLPNERLDNSSVTKQGNLISISTVASGLNTLQLSSGTAFLRTDGSTQTKAGSLQIDGVLTVSSVSTSVLLKTDGSTQTKTGGLIVSGALVLSSFSATNILYSEHIVDGQITSNDIANNIIAGIDILDGTITVDDIAPAAITTSLILNNTILSEDISADQITANEIATGGVGGAEIADGTVGTNDLAPTLTLNKITMIQLTMTSTASISAGGSSVFLGTTTITSSITVSGGMLVGNVEASSITVKGVLTTTNTASISAIKFGDGTTQTSASSGGGASPSSFTLIMGGAGDIYLATAASTSPDSFTTVKDSFTITSAKAFVTLTSTVSSCVFSILKTTETGNSNIAYNPIYSSSFTILPNNKFSIIASTFSLMPVLPNETLSFYCTALSTNNAAGTSGNFAGGRYGVILEGFKHPR